MTAMIGNALLAAGLIAWAYWPRKPRHAAATEYAGRHRFDAKQEQYRRTRTAVPYRVTRTGRRHLLGLTTKTRKALTI